MIKDKSDITQLIALNGDKIARFGVSSLKLFGSFASGLQTETSDVDVLIEFEPEEKTFDNFMGLSDLLEELFHRKVELVTAESLSPGMKKAILQTAEYVFRRN